jgi:hypothetical protein
VRREVAAWREDVNVSLAALRSRTRLLVLCVQKRKKWARLLCVQICCAKKNHIDVQNNRIDVLVICHTVA